MRLLVWNANLAVHAKLEVAVDRIAPDVAIIAECADEAILRRKAGTHMPECSMVWVGSDPNRGLGVFGFGANSVHLAACHDERLEVIAPIDVTGPHQFALVAVWAKNHRAKLHHPDLGHLPQPAAAATLYRDWFNGRDVVVAGDFNHNVLWDKKRVTVRNHSNTVAAWESVGLISAYHTFHGEPQGGETTPTIYWRNRTKDGPTYHIDYAFIPQRWVPAIRDVHVGVFDDWVATKLSDHTPILIDLDDAVIDTVSP